MERVALPHQRLQNRMEFVRCGFQNTRITVVRSSRNSSHRRVGMVLPRASSEMAIRRSWPWRAAWSRKVRVDRQSRQVPQVANVQTRLTCPQASFINPFKRVYHPAAAAGETFQPGGVYPPAAAAGGGGIPPPLLKEVVFEEAALVAEVLQRHSTFRPQTLLPIVVGHGDASMRPRQLLQNLGGEYTPPAAVAG